MLEGRYVLYAMAAVLPFALLWCGVLNLWKRWKGDGRAPRRFSLWSGLAALALSLLLQYQMTAQTRIPGPDADYYPQFWVASLLLFTYGLPATWVGLYLFSRASGTRPRRVAVCNRCGNTEHLHTEFCVRCGNRFLPDAS